MPECQQLHFNEMEMDDDAKRLVEYGVSDGCEVKLTVLEESRSAPIDYSVRTRDEKIVAVKVEDASVEEEKVEDVKMEEEKGEPEPTEDETVADANMEDVEP
jgi:hypothetical protein